MTDNIPQAPQEESVLFTSADGQTCVECRFESDTLWLSKGRYSPSQVIASYVELIK